MRHNKTHKLLLNAKIFNSMSITLKNEKVLYFNAFVDSPINSSFFSLRLKTSEQAQQILEIIKSYKEKISSSTTTTTTTSSSTTSSTTSSITSSTTTKEEEKRKKIIFFINFFIYFIFVFFFLFFLFYFILHLLLITVIKKKINKIKFIKNEYFIF